HWLRELAASHSLEVKPDVPLTPAILDDLRRRVDVIPPSLALAQAALESGWGTSRFAREGNNLFGIWCYTPG
ncbi:MAG TPA: glucosaminidase domain-containing protein, partial [Oceanipulchritudo sp.]|nr:glucosaminidase domain-containing protein [Oceanipulchritudo sp.]